MPINTPYDISRQREIAQRVGTLSAANAYNLAAGGIAGKAGLGGDIKNILEWANMAKGGYLPDYPESNFDVEGIGNLLGADTESGAFMAGDLFLPDPGDLWKVAISKATAMLKGASVGQAVFAATKSPVKSVKGEPVRAVNAARNATKPKPIEVFHSTGADFAEFDPSKGIGGQMWFTSSEDLAQKGYDGAAGAGRIVKAEIDVRNPAGWDEYDKFGIDELMSQGYDGLKLEGGGETVYAAFFPEQVRVLSNTTNKTLKRNNQPIK